MNKIYFHGIVRIFLLAVIMLLPAIALTSCSSDDDDEHYLYSISITSMNVSGSDMYYLSLLDEVEKKYDKSFTLTGSQESCDMQAKVKFTAAMTIVQNAVANVTGYSGYVTYVLTRNGETIASEQVDFEK
ncbi:MAG: hypothetical protein LUH22_11230 [Bacteroides sp.]|nr:hypothetical protein [Bacteroides sp.]